MIKLNENITIDTGGGCEVSFVRVANLGETKSIGFTSDCIVGYNCLANEVQFDGTQELWIAHNTIDLDEAVGIENAGVILQHYRLIGYCDFDNFVEGFSCPKCFDDNTDTYIESRKQSCLNCGHVFELSEEIGKQIDAGNMEKCTFCGLVADSETKVVGGYTILEACNDCEEEILNEDED